MIMSFRAALLLLAISLLTPATWAQKAFVSGSQGSQMIR
jgi:LPS O-antigen subunit length determinant protein (WzzB/FepE family)